MSAILRAGLFVSLSIISGSSFGDYRDDIGATALKNAVPGVLQRGRFTEVTQVEAGVSVSSGAGGASLSGIAWMPDLSRPELAGKRIIDRSGWIPGLYSAHATGVAKLFYGSNSLASGLSLVYCHEANDWVAGGFLHGDRKGAIPDYSRSRIINHSWEGKSPSKSFTLRALRHLDWLVKRDESINVIGVVGTSPITPILGGAFNAITVGSTGNQTPSTTPGLDEIYTSGRPRPDVVVPLGTASSAAPVVASAVALLVDKAHNEPELSQEPVQYFRITRGGDYVLSAEQPEVVRSVLMAGAQRVTHNRSFGNIVRYGQSPDLVGANGLDLRYGAGQINIFNSYQLLNAGEQNSLEDVPSTFGWIRSAGFDYDPHFGGGAVVQGNNSVATYYLTTSSSKAVLHASLTWNVDVTLDEAKGQETSRLDDIDLYLYDVTDSLSNYTKAPVLIAASTGKSDNSEHLWLSLERYRTYKLMVVAGTSGTVSDLEYGLAWRVEQDQDGDKVPDADDNCMLTANFDQFDADNDGFGNICDADLNNDLKVNSADIDIFKTRFGSNDPVADINGDGIVSPDDLAIMRKYVAFPPGPSGMNSK